MPEEWGSGLARTLHDRALEGTRELGANEGSLWVVEQNPRARRFYEREDWRADGQKKSNPFGVDELRYVRAL